MDATQAAATTGMAASSDINIEDLDFDSGTYKYYRYNVIEVLSQKTDS